MVNPTIIGGAECKNCRDVLGEDAKDMVRPLRGLR